MAWLVYRQRARHRKSGRLKRYTGAVFVKCVRPKLLDALGEDLWTHTLRLRGEEHEAGTVRGAGCLQGCDMLGPPAFVQAVDLVGPPGQRRAMRLEVTHTVADFKEQEGAGGDVEVRGGPFCSTTLTEQEARELGQLCGWSRAELLETDALKLPPLMRRHVLGLCYRCGGARGPEPLHWIGDCPARAFVAARALREALPAAPGHRKATPKPKPKPKPEPKPKPARRPPASAEERMRKFRAREVQKAGGKKALRQLEADRRARARAEAAAASQLFP
jgi:hypothetical protein